MIIHCPFKLSICPQPVTNLKWYAATFHPLDHLCSHGALISMVAPGDNIGIVVECRFFYFQIYRFQI
jgi:hypothetical protein